MTIKIVMGIPCAGKSTFIKKYFPNSRKIDLYDFQKQYKKINYFDIMQSYEDVKNELLESIRNNEDVILEHTLLKAIRREMYIEAIKEITDEPIDVYLIHPTIQRFKENHAIRLGEEFHDDELKEYFDTLEIPTTKEGFAHVYLVEDINKWGDVCETK